MNFLNTEARRFYAVAIAAVLIMSMALGGFFFFTSSKSKPAPVNRVSITSSDQTQISQILKNFVNDAGTFGVKTDSINSTNINQVRILLTSSAVAENAFSDSRASVYPGVYSRYLAKDGNLTYSTPAISNWFDELMSRDLITFNSSNPVVFPSSKGTFLDYDGSAVPSVNVSVNFTSVETKRTMTADDASWDGTYNVSKKQFNASFKALMVKTKDQGWRIYSLENFNDPFLLVTLGDPASNPYQSSQFNFKNIGIIKTNIGVDKNGKPTK